MNDTIKGRIKNDLNNKHNRLTKSRKAMLNILENTHLTFKEIQAKLQEKGFFNVATIYNNIYFFIKEKMIVELYLSGVKYYELAVTNVLHDSNDHIHLHVDEGELIREIYAPEILDFIRNYQELKSFDISSIQIILHGKNK